MAQNEIVPGPVKMTCDQGWLAPIGDSLIEE
jgi:hypothetical protein